MPATTDIQTIKPASPRAIYMSVVAGMLGIALCIVLSIKITDFGNSMQAGVMLTRDDTNPRALPSFVGNDLAWIGREAQVSEVELNVLPPDTGYSRSYYQNLDTGESVYFSIVLSGKGRGAIHRPELCLVGQGWTIEAKHYHHFELQGIPGGLRATVLDIERVVQTEQGEVIVPGLCAYWFVGRDRLAASNIERLAWFAWDRLTRLQTHRWAYIFAQTDCPDGREAGMARLQEIIGEVVPTVQSAGFDEGNEG